MHSYLTELSAIGLQADASQIEAEIEIEFTRTIEQTLAEYTRIFPHRAVESAILAPMIVRDLKSMLAQKVIVHQQ